MIKKPISRTQTPGYFFSAGKAAESRKRRGAERQPSKLPTSLDEMKAAPSYLDCRDHLASLCDCENNAQCKYHPDYYLRVRP